MERGPAVAPPRDHGSRSLVKPDQWQEVKAILAAALELPRSARVDFIADRCGHDAAIRSEVESLLAAEDDRFLENPALAAPTEEPLDGRQSWLPEGSLRGRTLSHYAVLEEIS